MDVRTLYLLSVSPHEDDHVSLERIIAHSNWKLLKTKNLFAAQAVLLQSREISVVLCDSNLVQGSWLDLLKHMQSLQHPPALIVASRLADERLWAEVLNLGGWDVLAKPFEPPEVLRSVKSAWEHWYRTIERAAHLLRIRRAS
jgi:DNA-binding NtrC family response regulator